jgi:hypothetical protein
MISNKTSITLALVGILITSLACTINVGGPGYPAERIPVSTEAVGELQASVETAVAAGSESGQITLVFTESQLTSFLAMKLQEQSVSFLHDPQVTLRDGQITLYGTARQGYFQANIKISVSASINDQGHLQIEVSAIDFGPLVVASAVKDALTATIQEAFTGAVGPAAIGLRLETVSIGDGSMVLTGRIR